MTRMATATGSRAAGAASESRAGRRSGTFPRMSSVTSSSWPRRSCPRTGRFGHRRCWWTYRRRRDPGRCLAESRECLTALRLSHASRWLSLLMREVQVIHSIGHMKSMSSSSCVDVGHEWITCSSDADDVMRKSSYDKRRALGNFRDRSCTIKRTNYVTTSLDSRIRTGR